MSYEGTYGEDETCLHDRYYKGCGLCWRLNYPPPKTEAEWERRENARRERERADL